MSNEPHETGLARVCEAPRGYHVKVDGKLVAHVGAGRSFDNPSRIDWHWYGGSDALGIPHKNSAAAGEKFDTKEACRDACVAYVKENLRLTGRMK